LQFNDENRGEKEESKIEEVVDLSRMHDTEKQGYLSRIFKKYLKEYSSSHGDSKRVLKIAHDQFEF
jgi:hypothetical protein